MILRILILFLPISITPLLGLLIAGAYLNFGGGEKDLLLLIPWILWSVIFIISGLWMWRTQPLTKNWLIKSLKVSVLVTLVLWLCLFVYSILISL